MNDLGLLDFRRTLATCLYTEIKAEDLTAKAVLNHYDRRPVAVYARLNYDRLAAIIQEYADWVWQLMPREDRQTTFNFVRAGPIPVDQRRRLDGGEVPIQAPYQSPFHRKKEMDHDQNYPTKADPAA